MKKQVLPFSHRANRNNLHIGKHFFQQFSLLSTIFGCVYRLKQRSLTITDIIEVSKNTLRDIFTRIWQIYPNNVEKPVYDIVSQGEYKKLTDIQTFHPIFLVLPQYLEVSKVRDSNIFTIIHIIEMGKNILKRSTAY